MVCWKLITLCRVVRIRKLSTLSSILPSPENHINWRNRKNNSLADRITSLAVHRGCPDNTWRITPILDPDPQHIQQLFFNHGHSTTLPHGSKEETTMNFILSLEGDSFSKHIPLCYMDSVPHSAFVIQSSKLFVLYDTSFIRYPNS